MIYVCIKQCDNSQVKDVISTREPGKIHWYDLHPDYWRPACNNFKVLEFNTSIGRYKLCDDSLYRLYKSKVDELHPYYTERTYTFDDVCGNIVLKLQFDDGTILTPESKIKYHNRTRSYGINDICINDWHKNIECRVLDQGWTLLSVEIAKGNITIVKDV